ncbi:haloacid dehalogenase superfamily, subfamily IA, variant 3 with third motif having DD or ED [Austwickia chelonae]|uniref:Putative hydrolase n=1 Tax=Austwickia chelonae NBRC 105200 TaxID=1184607 RepID=K6V4R3_9MICO|nr:HAD family phosphatase [Austwickia chelonae]GAB77143.1 putative hydrolase [Austwickia chelonae NBRC 105200]SEW03737.1 haloacid dehalogenase superfamily, subfamily IA, variant 3 with third motif having DD or ED [Austwickia chelonae]
MNPTDPPTPAPDLPTAVLWDFDGTVMHTEPYWYEEERHLVEEYGGTWTMEDALTLVGKALPDSAALLRAHSPVTLPVPQIVDRLQNGVVERIRDHVPWRPGARELLHELHAARIPQALVTMSWRPILDIVLGELPPGIFTAIVTGDAVTRGKPHPEPYLTALTMLGVPSAARLTCVAVEDSVTGSTSAADAGIPTLVTPSVEEVPPRPGLVLLDSLAGVRAADLLPLACPAVEDHRAGIGGGVPPHAGHNAR